MAKLIRLEEYHVSSKTGFMLEDPKEYLPEYFEPWNQLARTMPELVAKQEMRKAVGELQLLDHTRLSGYREQRLAHLQLGVITSGYVWQDGDPGVSQSVPECIAIPYWKISEILGLRPVLSHADLFLANWKYTDDHRDIEPLYLVPGGESCKWFCLVTSSAELTFAKAIHPLQKILDALQENDKTLVFKSLNEVADIVADMFSAMKRYHDNMVVDTFFSVVRPYIAGWGGESSPLPDGLIYKGISEEPLKVVGVTAAQSTAIPVLDILLGVQHQPDKQAFLLEMRNYMPPSHKQLLVDVENMPQTLPNMVSECQDDNLLAAYNKCLEALKQFRNYHIQLVTKYIVMAAKKNTDSTNKSLANKGTGGTDLLPFLKELRDDTNQKILETDSGR